MQSGVGNKINRSPGPSMYTTKKQNPQNPPLSKKWLAQIKKEWTSESGLVGDVSQLQRYGVKVFSDSIYKGELLEQKRHGKGIMRYMNNRVYEGDWDSDQRHGMGYERFQNGNIYRGQFERGKAGGKGKYKWVNGEEYDGDWKDGFKNGKGIWKSNKGDQYVGDWVKGKAEGNGVHVWSNGDKYEGEWKQFLKHGKGEDYFNNGDTYIGDYKLGKPDGKGKYTWSNKSSYEGEFKKGLKHGKGKWRKGEGDLINEYIGEYYFDKKHGKGTFKWASGNVYTGEYRNDEREGFGVMTWTDGSKYEGQWSRGIQHGFGKMVLSDGAIKEGYFDNNIYVGKEAPNAEYFRTRGSPMPTKSPKRDVNQSPFGQQSMHSYSQPALTGHHTLQSHRSQQSSVKKLPSHMSSASRLHKNYDSDEGEGSVKGGFLPQAPTSQKVKKPMKEYFPANPYPPHPPYQGQVQQVTSNTYYRKQARKTSLPIWDKPRFRKTDSTLVTYPKPPGMPPQNFRRSFDIRAKKNSMRKNKMNYQLTPNRPHSYQHRQQRSMMFVRPEPQFQNYYDKRRSNQTMHANYEGSIGGTTDNYTPGRISGPQIQRNIAMQKMQEREKKKRKNKNYFLGGPPPRAPHYPGPLNGSQSARLHQEMEVDDFTKSIEKYDDESYNSLSPKAKTHIAAMSGPPLIMDTSGENFFKENTPVHQVQSYMREQRKHQMRYMINSHSRAQSDSTMYQPRNYSYGTRRINPLKPTYSKNISIRSKSQMNALIGRKPYKRKWGPRQMRF